MRIDFLLDNPNLLETSEMITLIEDHVTIYHNKLYYFSNIKEDYLKPYSFYLSLFKKKGIEAERTLKFTFSSINKDIFVILYNNLIKNSFSPFSEFRLKRALIEPLLEIKGNIAIFKTLMPIILEVKDNQWYLMGDNKIIEEQISYFVIKLSQYYLNENLEFFEFRPIELYKVAIKKDREILQGFEGIFEIKAVSRVLNLIFDVGLGYKKNLGFGMLNLFSMKRFDKYLYKKLVTLNE